MTTRKITFVGVGNMGHALVQALLKAGHAVTIWNRTPTRPQVQSAVSAGAVFEPALDKAFTASDIVIFCVHEYNQIAAFVEGAQLDGKTVISLTNGTPAQAKAMADQVMAAGASTYLDGAVMVTPPMVGGPHSTLVMSGATEEAFEALNAHVFPPLGATRYLGPDAGAAARFDCAALSTMYGLFSGAFVGMALLREGNPEKQIGSIVGDAIVPMMAGLTHLLTRIAKAWDDETFGDHKGNPMGMQVEALRCIKEACSDDGVDFGSLEVYTGLMERAMKDFGGESDVAAVGTYLSRKA